MNKAFVRDIVYEIIDKDFKGSYIPKDYIEIAVDVISKANDNIRLENIKNVVKTLSKINYIDSRKGA